MTLLRDARPLGAAGSPVAVRTDPATGLPVALERAGTVPVTVPLEVELTLVHGGREVLAPIGGLVYEDVTRTRLEGAGTASVERRDAGDTTIVITRAAAAGWEVELTYRFAPRTPHVALGFTVRRTGEDAVRLRDVELRFVVPGDWTLNAPGNACRAELDLRGVREPIELNTAGGSRGSAGLVALTRETPEATVLLWPWCRTELGVMDLHADGGAVVTLATQLAGVLEPGGDGLTWEAVHLDLLPGAWPELRAALPAAQARLQGASPSEPPQWIRAASVYEAHVGFSVFADGQRYERYADAAALEADLGRIQDLGFDVLQLMPRHPYPSYNVHDYADLATTYGDEAELRSLVRACHARGIRVLLDVIMHGVVDRDVMQTTIDAVEAGPHAGHLADGTLDYLARSMEDVAWSRHIVEYGPHWLAGAPQHHPLLDEHPGWFMHDSAGAVTRRYTHAFDIADPDWQAYFIDACVAMVERLGVDGFRVDAPTYNEWADWSPGRAQRASYGPMAALGLLSDLRLRLRSIDPELLVYTEPGGVLFRAVADATYNYDELWLVEALFAPPHAQSERRLVRNAREAARWLEDRDATLPPDSVIVHHSDSHDSIWWRLPGEQWRRERFGRDGAVALLALLSLTGGAYMTFMGGEDELEAELRRTHALRRALPVLAHGSVDYAAVRASADDVFVVLRRLGDQAAIVAINLSGAPVTCAVEVPGRPPAGTLRDHWNDESLAADDLRQLAFAPYQPRVIGLPAEGGNHAAVTRPTSEEEGQ